MDCLLKYLNETLLSYSYYSSILPNAKVIMKYFNLQFNSTMTLAEFLCMVSFEVSHPAKDTATSSKAPYTKFQLL